MQIDDGNGQVDLVGDTFGLVAHYNTGITNYLFAFEVPVSHIDDSGNVVLDFNDPNTMMNSVVEKVYDLFYNSLNGGIIMTDNMNSEYYGFLHDESLCKKFSTGTSLFTNTRLLGLEILKISSAEYGIMPFPKYNEEQQNYHSHVDGRGSLLFVPYTLPENEYENVGILLGALAKETSSVVMPNIIKSALPNNPDKDSDAYKCLEMTLAGRTYAFAYVFDIQLTSHPYWAIVNIMRSRSNRFTDYWKSKSRTAECEINTVYTKYAELH